jgi:predicted DNA-binding transcriptional regulator YafY
MGATPRNVGLVRTLAIMRVFEQGGRLTIYALAERFGVSPRTIRRDLSALEAVGFPITNEGYPDHGHRGEWWLCR